MQIPRAPKSIPRQPRGLHPMTQTSSKRTEDAQRSDEENPYPLLGEILQGEPWQGPQGDGASLNADQGIGPMPLGTWTQAGSATLSAKHIPSPSTSLSSQSPQPLTESLPPMPDRDMEAQGTGWSWPSGACKARDPPEALCFLLTLAQQGESWKAFYSAAHVGRHVEIM